MALALQIELRDIAEPQSELNGLETDTVFLDRCCVCMGKESI